MNRFSTCVVSIVVVVFVLGLHLYTTKGYALARKEGLDSTPTKVAPATCPSTLFRRDGKYVLQQQQQPQPTKEKEEKVFDTFDAYVKYRDEHLKACPVLFVQQEYNTQGHEVQRIRESPVEQDGGSVTEIADGSRDTPPYNQNQYAGVDPTMQYLGVYTSLDQIHDSTRKQEISDNPMDPNWGGVLYTQAQIDQGKYADYNITKPHYTMPLTTKGPVTSPYGIPPPPPGT